MREQEVKCTFLKGYSNLVFPFGERGDQSGVTALIELLQGRAVTCCLSLRAKLLDQSKWGKAWLSLCVCKVLSTMGPWSQMGSLCTTTAITTPVALTGSGSHFTGKLFSPCYHHCLLKLRAILISSSLAKGI